MVVGCSGSGKTTLARRIAARLDVPHLEMDGVYHQPGWTHVDDVTFEQSLVAFAAGESWVADGNYYSYGSAAAIWPRVDAVVWLDLPKRVVMRQVIGRTLRRAFTREVLWNDNREPWANLYSLDPERNIVVWTWTRFDKYRARYERCSRDGTWAHASVFRLRSRSEIDDFVDSITPGPAG